MPGAAQASTGPPMRSVVWRAIGSSKLHLAVAGERVDERLVCRSSRTRLQDLLADHPDVAGAERDDDVAVAQLRAPARAATSARRATCVRAEVARRAHLLDERAPS